MSEKIIVRLFVEPKCSCGSGCGPDTNVESFSNVADKLTKKLGKEHFEFEVYKDVNLKSFPFLRKAAKSKLMFPIVTLDEKIFCQGKIPSSNELEKEVAKMLGKMLK
jgi:disulfide oxidoreductase YuzD